MSRFHTPKVIILRHLPRIISKRAPPNTIQVQCLSTVRELLLKGPLPAKQDIDTETPFVIRSRFDGDDDDGSHNISISKWFSTTNAVPKFTDYLNQHLNLTLPYELILPSKTHFDANPNNNAIKRFILWLSDNQEEFPHKTNSKPPYYHLLSVLLQQEISNATKTPTTPNNDNNDVRFLRFDAPLALLSAGLEYNSIFPETPLTQLYIAQAPLSNLPPALQADLLIPSLLSHLGRGDIYGSSIWLGLEPTYTPWHRDPNPNLFCQLRRKKVMRLMPPNRGRNLFERVQAELRQQGASWRIRGDEMMQGAERRALSKAVWESNTGMTETVVRPGDLLYLPQGWWHSVRSSGQTCSGALNVSVNWWFR
ncbi:hypothetical protein QBC44DRAFT_336911 [Cladorrhinum sp. PSN332]|nr:hypothetical protein QBC44DRAFT_336911 [Cladorrhinum sp. PSN332]